MSANDRPEYVYGNGEPGQVSRYLWPTVIRILADLSGRRVFDLGCGNGALAAHLTTLGYEVTGVDPSESGIAQARRAHPDLRVHLGSAYDDLASRYDKFEIVISLEVIEHVYSPRHYARTLADLLVPGGTAIISTPYHSYAKNLALAVTGKMERHFTALWDHGHIKFWSRQTLGILLRETGFTSVRFVRVGRIPPLAKSMIAIASR
jgi:2-polyprenyl-6-hydroxyphenyl methylase/3-demethylubiquinone-9 3-methyltransferase